MTTLQEFRCEICGRTTNKPDHWFVIECRDAELTVLKWNLEAANARQLAISVAKPMRRFTLARNPESQSVTNAAMKRGFQTRSAELELGRMLGELVER